MLSTLQNHISGWSAVPCDQQLQEECAARVSDLRNIRDIIEWLRDIECPFRQEAMLRAFRRHWHNLERACDHIATYRTDDGYGLRCPEIDQTINSLIHLAQNRQTTADDAQEPALVAIKPQTSTTTHHSPLTTHPSSQPTIMNVTIQGNANIFEAGSITGNQSITISCGASEPADIVAPVRPASSTSSVRPAALLSDEARELLLRAQNAGLLDQDMQPVCTRTMATVLAAEIADHLSLTPRWAPFEQLWGYTRMCNTYQKALGQLNFSALTDRVQQALGL